MDEHKGHERIAMINAARQADGITLIDLSQVSAKSTCAAAAGACEPSVPWKAGHQDIPVRIPCRKMSSRINPDTVSKRMKVEAILFILSSPYP
jgi:hypothetical protein